MTKAPISLQDLRRSLYVKAKAEPSWRFWGLYVHVCKIETLREAYEMARSNRGAPGIDGVTFEAIEESGAEGFVVQIRDELVTNTYRPMQARKKEIPKDGGKKVRVLSIPAIRDRVVQGALKLILEPIFEADFQAGSFGYRPKRTAHEAVARVVQRESRSSTIGHITLGMKQTGAPSAGNPHAGCDVAGTGNGFTVGVVRHSQRKRGAMDRPNLRNTAPVLDPTPSVREPPGPVPR
jgi:Reverse transcriptase (RNA-dependent DNA polymerase)